MQHAVSPPRPAAGRPLAWAPAPWDERLEEATLEVPLDYADPAGESITLALSRHRATSPERRRGVLLSVNGGPGGDNGTGRALAGRLSETPLAEVYDLIGFDPRGTGASTRLNAETIENKAPFDSRPPDSAFPLIAEDMRRRDEACQQAGGRMRPHVSTRNTARDMDRIREALGEPRISFVGWAYGSMVGAVYGTMFGAHLDRSVLDSAVHPDWDWHQQFMIQGLAVRESVEAWAEWAGQRHGQLGLGRTGREVLDAVEEIAAGLAGPMDAVPLRTAFDGLVGFTAPHRPRWAMLAELAGQLRTAVAVRDTGTARDLLEGKTHWRPGDSLGELREAVLEAVTCETPWPRELETYYADMRAFRELYPYAFGVTRAQPWVATFASFEPPEPPVSVGRDGYPEGVVVQADADPWDYYLGGQALAERLGHRLVMVEDSGAHEVYALSGNRDVDAHVHRYLLHGILPPLGTVCPGDPRPGIPADDPADEPAG